MTAKKGMSRFVSGVTRLGHMIKTKQYHAKFGNLAPLPCEVIKIDPKDICGHLNKHAARKLYDSTGYRFGAVAKGDWDKEVEYLNFTQKEVYKSCKLRWVHGYSWDKTPQYQIYVDRLHKGVPCRFGSLQELKDRYRALDEIFKEVSRAQELSSKINDLITVSLTRDGRLIWGPDGRHRLCIALIAGLNSIPVRVRYIHPQSIDAFQLLRTNK